ncbi:Ankyrin-3 [Tetrabaena socialis]|uniref:Ankyrin-3 n=1 Tax=Tetrabaena socialis TaxID=47790 RepID=A0A2J8ABV2_9CHLO|nr:Ankyrin-3 [Tetrabaena socialis]|eukprot:PNH10004.1 Ankyrin-3 [Tetrabaena socialis]
MCKGRGRLRSAASSGIVVRDGYTALDIASEHGYEKVVEALLAMGANNDATEEEYGWTSLHIACVSGHEEVVKALLADGANTEARDETGETALYIASQSGYTAVVKALLAAGADKEAKNAVNPGEESDEREHVWPGAAPSHSRAPEGQQRSAPVECVVVML